VVGPTNRTPVRGAARLAAILDALPDALLLVDDSAAIVNANAAALNLFEGESAERLLGVQLAQVLPGIGRTLATPGSAPAALPAGSSASLDPRDLAGAPAAVRRPPERMAARRTDGSVFPAEVTTAELAGEDAGELSLYVVRDLTGVLDVEAELRRQQRQIELILRAASEGIIGVDHEGRIVLVNPAGAKILRYRAADLGGRNVHELLTHSRADGTPLPDSECPLLDSVRTGAKHRAVDSVLWRSDGGAVYVDLTTAPVYEGENIIGAVMTFVDNSAARATARQAAELTDVLDKDLRGALTDVAARLQQYIEYGEAGYAAEQLPELAEVGADLERLAELATDLVDFQQSVLGTLEYRPEAAQLAEVLDEAVLAAAPTAAACGVEIAAHCAEVEVDLDPRLFVKLLIHLLADMVAVSPVGGKIVVTAARRGALARIEIRGPHTGGSPLHLPIAQAIAVKHGGTVTTHRIAGKGNTHVIEVPVSQPDSVRPTAAASPSAASSSTSAENAAQSATSGASASSSATATETAAEVSTANGHSTSLGTSMGGTSMGAQRRRRAAAAEVQARIPAQSSRSTLSRTVNSIADLRPSRPMPTGDVWSKPERSLTSDPDPAELEQASNPPTLTSTDSSASSTAAAPASVTTTVDAPAPQPWRAEPEPVATPSPTQAQAQTQTQTPSRAETMTPPRPLPRTTPGSQAATATPIAPTAPPTPEVQGAAPPRGRRRAAAAEGEPTQLLAPVPATPEQARSEPEPEPNPPVEPAQPDSDAEDDVQFGAGSVSRIAPAEPAEPEHPRLLLWPDPDKDTAALLRSRGYEPMSLGQPDRLPILAANGTGKPHPFAVFVDPISAPITRRGLREVRAAAPKAGLPLLVTAGIGRAADGREFGPDPSLLLTALCPADVRLPRVLLVEARTDLAEAIAEVLERQGMQVAHATTDAESRESAVAAPPDLVLLDLMQIRRRRVGVVDWLRDRGLLARTPLVVYTAEGSDTGGLDSLYLTERATDAEPAGRIGDLLAKIAP